MKIMKMQRKKRRSELTKCWLELVSVKEKRRAIFKMLQKKLLSSLNTKNYNDTL